MATTTPSVEQKQILGAVLIELLIGNLTDELIEEREKNTPPIVY